MWWVKLLVVLLLAAAIVSLFKALWSLVRDEGGSRKTMRALAWRVGFSVAVFLLLLLSMYMGWVEPHGLKPTPQSGAPIQGETTGESGTGAQ